MSFVPSASLTSTARGGGVAPPRRTRFRSRASSSRDALARHHTWRTFNPDESSSGGGRPRAARDFARGVSPPPPRAVSRGRASSSSSSRGARRALHPRRRRRRGLRRALGDGRGPRAQRRSVVRARVPLRGAPVHPRRRVARVPEPPSVLRADGHHQRLRRRAPRDDPARHRRVVRGCRIRVGGVPRRRRLRLPRRPLRRRRRRRRLAAPGVPNERGVRAVRPGRGLVRGGDRDDEELIAEDGGVVPGGGSRRAAARLVAAIPWSIKHRGQGIEGTDAAREELENVLDAPQLERLDLGSNVPMQIMTEIRGLDAMSGAKSELIYQLLMDNDLTALHKPRPDGPPRGHAHARELLATHQPRLGPVAPRPARGVRERAPDLGARPRVAVRRVAAARHRRHRDAARAAVHRDVHQAVLPGVRGGGEARDGRERGRRA